MFSLDDILAETLSQPLPDYNDEPEPAPGPASPQANAGASVLEDMLSSMGAPQATQSSPASPADTSMLGVVSPESPVKAQGEGQDTSSVDLYLSPAPSKASPKPVDPSQALQAINARLAARELIKRQAQALSKAQGRTLDPMGMQARAVSRVDPDAQGTFYRMADGSWGVRIDHSQGQPKVGDSLSIRRKDGTLRWVEISSLEGQDSWGVVCRIVDLRAKPVCPGNNNCRRLGHKRGANCH